MNSAAIEQARARLRKAETATTELKAASSFEDAESAWTDFLLACSGIYSKLEQGAKGYGKSEPWFGAEKNLRKSDPLLRYLHFARNSDEHGIDRVTSRSTDNSDLRFNERRYVQISKVDPVTNEPTGEWHDGVLAGPTLKLTRVHDSRFGDFCDPPKTHLGRQIPYGESFPHDIAHVALEYLRDMIDRAQALVP